MSPLKLIRRWLHWHDREPSEREFLSAIAATIMIVGVFLLFGVLLFGCQSPQRIPACTCSPRLTEVLRFETCMTGPWDTLWIQEGAAVKEGDACGYFNVLVLPRGCEAFDVDRDGDVDLADYARVRNGES